MPVRQKIHIYGVLTLGLGIVRKADGQPQGEARRLRFGRKLLQIELFRQWRKPYLPHGSNAVFLCDGGGVTHHGVQLGDFLNIVGFFLLFLFRHAGMADDVQKLHLYVLFICEGDFRLIGGAGPAGLEFLKNFVVAHLEEAPACAGDGGGVGPLEHFVGILLIRHPQAQAEPGVGPDLVVHHAGGLLSGQNEVYAQRTAHPGRRYQRPYKFRLFFFQLRELVGDYQQMGHGLAGGAGSVKLYIGVDMLYLVLVEYPLAAAYLGVDGEKRPVGGVAAQIGYHARKMGKPLKALGHAAALVVDEHEGHFVRVVIDDQRQDIALQSFRFARAGGAGHKTVGAVVFFVDVQIQGLVARLVADEGAHTFIGAVFQPFVVHIQGFHR